MMARQMRSTNRCSGEGVRSGDAVTKLTTDANPNNRTAVNRGSSSVCTVLRPTQCSAQHTTIPIGSAKNPVCHVFGWATIAIAHTDTVVCTIQSARPIRRLYTIAGMSGKNRVHSSAVTAFRFHSGIFTAELCTSLNTTMWLVSRPSFRVKSLQKIKLPVADTDNSWKTKILDLQLGDCLNATDTVDKLVQRKWLVLTDRDTDTLTYELQLLGIQALQNNRKVHAMHHTTSVSETSIRTLIHKMRVTHDNLIKVQFNGMGAKTASEQTRDESVKIAAYSTMRAAYEKAFEELKTKSVISLRAKDETVATDISDFTSLADFIKYYDDPSDDNLAVNAAALQHLDPVLCGFSNTVDGIAATSRTNETMEGDVSHLANLIWHTTHAIADNNGINYILWVEQRTARGATTSFFMDMQAGNARSSTIQLQLSGQTLHMTRGSSTAAAARQLSRVDQMCSSTWTGNLDGDAYTIAFGPYPHVYEGRWYCEDRGTIFSSLSVQDKPSISHLFKTTSNATVNYIAVTPAKCIACSETSMDHKLKWTNIETKRLLPDVLYPASGYHFTQTQHTLDVKVLLTPDSYVITDAVPIDQHEMALTSSGSSLSIPTTDNHLRVWKCAGVQHDAQLPIIGMMGRKRRTDASEPTMKWSVGVRGSPFLTAMEVTLNVVHHGIPIHSLEFGGFHYGVLNADTGLQETSTALLSEESLKAARVINSKDVKHRKDLVGVLLPFEDSPFYAPAQVNVRGCDVYGMTTTCSIENHFTETPALLTAMAVVDMFLRQHTPPLTQEAITYLKKYEHMYTPTKREKLLAAHAYALGTAQATDKWHDEKVLSRLESQLRSLIAAWVTNIEPDAKKVDLALYKEFAKI